MVISLPKASVKTSAVTKSICGSGAWVFPYHVPPEPKEDGNEGDGWVLPTPTGFLPPLLPCERPSQVCYTRELEAQLLLKSPYGVTYRGDVSAKMKQKNLLIFP